MRSIRSSTIYRRHCLAFLWNIILTFDGKWQGRPKSCSLHNSIITSTDRCQYFGPILILYTSPFWLLPFTMYHVFRTWLESTWTYYVWHRAPRFDFWTDLDDERYSVYEKKKITHSPPINYLYVNIIVLIFLRRLTAVRCRRRRWAYNEIEKEEKIFLYGKQLFCIDRVG